VPCGPCGGAWSMLHSHPAPCHGRPRTVGAPAGCLRPRPAARRRRARGRGSRRGTAGCRRPGRAPPPRRPAAAAPAHCPAPLWWAHTVHVSSQWDRQSGCGHSIGGCRVKGTVQDEAAQLQRSAWVLMLSNACHPFQTCAHPARRQCAAAAALSAILAAARPAWPPAAQPPGADGSSSRPDASAAAACSVAASRMSHTCGGACCRRSPCGVHSTGISLRPGSAIVQ
jgi:hypothetical protein